jgi:adenylate cyclase
MTHAAALNSGRGSVFVRLGVGLLRDNVRLRLRRQTGPMTTIDARLPVEFGRLDPTLDGEATPFQSTPRADGSRIVIAPAQEPGVSRRQAVLERNRLLRNLSESISMRLAGGRVLEPGGSEPIGSSSEFRVGPISIEIVEAPSNPGEPFIAAHGPPTPPPPTPTWFAPGATAGSMKRAAPDMQSIITWWKRVISLLQSASSTTDFFQKAADALVELVGLDLGAVYLKAQDGWKPMALAPPKRPKTSPSSNILGRVFATGETVWKRGVQSVDARSSLAELEAYVAAPIQDGSGVCHGVLYGHRSGDPDRGCEISDLEVSLVETLACGVAAGLARITHEEAAIRQRVTFSQFFSPDLARRIEKQPDLLGGRDADVSVLFCDIQGFSTVSETLGAAQTMDWIGDVLSELSDCVLASGGVLVDYIGDELMAMWGAPQDQPDHAMRACTAARAMLGCLPKLDRRWLPVIGHRTRLSIGINSGMARVGNTGSTRKFKYGPLGNPVNIASRVRGATKYLKVNSLITGQTRRSLSGSIAARRVATVQLVNIAQPIELHELVLESDPSDFFSRYEEALEAFESGDFAKTTRILGSVLDVRPGDGPSLVLLSRAVEALLSPPADFSPVWQLSAK